jgi:integrase
MIEINWKRDYAGEFICCYCDKPGLALDYWSGKKNIKRMFRCNSCNKRIVASVKIKSPDPTSGINWQSDYKIGEFACPNPVCNSRDIRVHGLQRGKRLFSCAVCKTYTLGFITISYKNVSRFNHSRPSIEPFHFEDDRWDLRNLIPEFDAQCKFLYVYFDKVQPNWFKFLAKLYIQHKCKLETAPASICRDVIHLRFFSRYLAERNIKSIDEVNCSTVQDFLTWDKTGVSAIRSRLGTLREFFLIGNVKGWFKVNQDIIRDEDFPKKKLSNPSPLSDTVREQIENKLHKLPDPIARMWLIAFFTAMRPNELALLKKNCLVQEGSNWKIVWWRKKGKNQHEVPITRTIAKVVQEQLEYIEQFWGADWDYLFCHYYGVSKEDPSQPKLQPVKKIIPKDHDPLSKAIRCLIKSEDIRDENGKLAEFTPCLVRPSRLTQLFEQGHELAVVSAWAGHKQLATTALHYTYVSCDLIEKEAGHIQKALFNAEGQYMRYESLPKSFWVNPRAHQLDLPENHINTPIYGYCGLPLDQSCNKFRACYTCSAHFVAVPEKLPLYIKTRNELRAKQDRAMEAGADVLVEQYQRQADNLDKIIAGLEGDA